MANVVVWTDIPVREKQLMDMVGWIAFSEDTEGSRIGIPQPE